MAGPSEGLVLCLLPLPMQRYPLVPHCHLVVTLSFPNQGTTASSLLPSLPASLLLSLLLTLSQFLFETGSLYIVLDVLELTT